MAISLGKVKLIGVQDVHTEESRNLVEQRVPDQKGSVFQDLGREPVVVVIEGLLFGEEVMSEVEHLRTAQEKVEPLPFASDIAVGSDMTDVIIEDLKMYQTAGYANRYRFSIRVREYVEPPESQAQADAPVNDAVQADADAWEEDSLAAAAALEDPQKIPETMAANPGALAQVSADELGNALTDNAANLSPDNVGGILKSIGENDPAKLGGVLTSMQEQGGLASFVQKFVETGKNLQEMLSGVDLMGVAQGLVTLFTDGVNLIKELKDLPNIMKELTNLIGDFTLKKFLESIETGIEKLKAIIISVKKIAGTVITVIDKLKDVGIKIVQQLKCIDMAVSIQNTVIVALQKVGNGLVWIANQLIDISGVAAMFGITLPVFNQGGSIIEALGNQFIHLSMIGKQDLRKATKFFSSLRSKIEKVDITDILLAAEKLFYTNIDVSIYQLGNTLQKAATKLQEIDFNCPAPTPGAESLT